MTFTESFVEAAGGRVHLRSGGTGPPLLVLHGELGVPGWLGAYEQLARQYTVFVPSLPGFGQSSRPDFVLTVQDLAAWVTWFVRDQRLGPPLPVVGFSLGGWLAAEIATVNDAIFSKMVLVGAAGLKPDHGEVWDYFIHSNRQAFARALHEPAKSEDYARFYDKDWTQADELQAEQNREMAARLVWKPYMRSVTLAGRLGGVTIPTLVVWGREDAIIPVEVCDQYVRAIPGATAKVLDGAGHMPEMDRPDAFAQVVLDFLRAGR